MSYEAMHKVRASGLTDRTQVDVLEALAFFLNKETGACFPSTESIARIARLSPNIARRAIKELEEVGYISTNQKPGGKRHFVLHLDRLPIGCMADEGVSEVTGVSEVKGVSKVTGLPCQKCDPSPVRSVRGPISDLTPEQVIKKEFNKVSKKVYDAPASDDLFTNDGQMIEKPKKSRAKPKTQCPFSPDEQIPDDYLAYAKEKHPSIDAPKEFRKFVNSAYANGRKYSDWKAAWRTWTANAEDWKPKTTYTQRNNAPLRFDDAYYGDGSF